MNYKVFSAQKCSSYQQSPLRDTSLPCRGNKFCNYQARQSLQHKIKKTLICQQFIDKILKLQSHNIAKNPTLADKIIVIIENYFSTQLINARQLYQLELNIQKFCCKEIQHSIKPNRIESSNENKKNQERCSIQQKTFYKPLLTRSPQKVSNKSLTVLDQLDYNLIQQQNQDKNNFLDRISKSVNLQKNIQQQVNDGDNNNDNSNYLFENDRLKKIPISANNNDKFAKFKEFITKAYTTNRNNCLQRVTMKQLQNILARQQNMRDQQKEDNQQSQKENNLIYNNEKNDIEEQLYQSCNQQNMLNNDYTNTNIKKDQSKNIHQKFLQYKQQYNNRYDQFNKTAHQLSFNNYNCLQSRNHKISQYSREQQNINTCSLNLGNQDQTINNTQKINITQPSDLQLPQINGCKQLLQDLSQQHISVDQKIVKVKKHVSFKLTSQEADNLIKVKVKDQF